MPSSPATDRRPAVSVILPARLRSGDAREIDWLEAAIDSVGREADAAAAATQLVLVDDGSAVDVAAAAARALARRARVALDVVEGPRRGLVAALNRGLAVATADWIARIDADDLWLEGKLASQLAHVAEAPDDTLVFGGMTLIDEEGLTTGEVPRVFDWAAALTAPQLGLCAPPHGAVLGRRDVFRRLGGYPGDAEADACEDFHLWCRWARFFPICGLDRLLLAYRLRSGSESRVHAETQRRNSALVVAAAQELGDAAEYVAAFDTLCRVLGVDRVTLGTQLHSAWLVGGRLNAPVETLTTVRRLLYDRVVWVDREEGGLRVALF